MSPIRPLYLFNWLIYSLNTIDERKFKILRHSILKRVLYILDITPLNLTLFKLLN